jgi:uncharacterized protein (DUF488 family)
VSEAFTLGHSTQSLDALVQLLRDHGIEELWDVRVMPYSRRNPQFARDALAAALPRDGIRYVHAGTLGGFRRPRPDSENAGWRNTSFRGYADYMQTPEFQRAIATLVRAADTARLGAMCAEALPWRCHRSLIADALTVRGVTVRHLFPDGTDRPHRLTPWAQVEGTRLLYPKSAAPRRPAAGHPGQTTLDRTPPTPRARGRRTASRTSANG